MDPQIQFKDPIDNDEDHVIYLNADLFNQVFLQKYNAYTNNWIDLIEYRDEKEIYSINYIYTDDIMFLPKKYHECYKENKEDGYIHG